MPAVPHSFVLADVFQLESMALDVPDHVYEDDAGIDWVSCPRCNGTGWVEVQGSAYFDERWVQWHPALAYNSAPCLRCHADGQVLDVVESWDDDGDIFLLLAA